MPSSSLSRSDIANIVARRFAEKYPPVGIPCGIIGGFSLREDRMAEFDLFDLDSAWAAAQGSASIVLGLLKNGAKKHGLSEDCIELRFRCYPDPQTNQWPDKGKVVGQLTGRKIPQTQS